MDTGVPWPNEKLESNQLACTGRPKTGPNEENGDNCLLDIHLIFIPDIIQLVTQFLNSNLNI